MTPSVITGAFCLVTKPGMKLFAVPHDRKRVGAQAVGHRFDQRDGGRSCDDGIDRVAAFGKHREAGLRGQRLRCADDIAC
jgi:hypothetical protein